jgi:hypothetical protein
MDAYDDKLRTRLAEIRASAGVPHSQISLEVLYFLPQAFLTQYQEMFVRALKSDGGEDQRNRSQQEAGQVEKAAGGSTGRRYKKSFVVLDEKALDLKSTIDKRLRMVARDIRAGLAGESEEAREAGGPTRCGRCGTFISRGWKYCPKDGSPQVID